MQLLERDGVLVDSLLAVKVRLAAAAISVLRVDALSWMPRAPADRFELVFIDPPFDGGLAPAAAVAAGRLVVPGGYLYVESDVPLAAPPAGHTLFRQFKAGAVHAQLWQRDA